MKKKYSVAIHPSEAIILLVKDLKKKLFEEINWFHSKNSIAHITICEFEATDAEIEIIKNKLDLLCDTLEPFEVDLNGFDWYPNGAFFITANEVSKTKLKEVMKKAHESLRFLKMQKSSEPHLSIARRLTPENIEKANRLFTTINSSFMCDTVVLRKFDSSIKQFFIIDSFKFNSNKKPELIQGKLF